MTATLDDLTALFVRLAETPSPSGRERAVADLIIAEVRAAGLDVHERHRHRYEVNNDLRPQLEVAGLVVSGTTADGRLVEMVELKDHPWFVASQFHPEFKSRPTRPAPLFRDFVGAATRLRVEREDELEESCAER